jgi:hypothetical protein
MTNVIRIPIMASTIPTIAETEQSSGVDHDYSKAVWENATFDRYKLAVTLHFSTFWDRILIQATSTNEHRPLKILEVILLCPGGLKQKSKPDDMLVWFSLNEFLTHSALEPTVVMFRIEHPERIRQ